MATIRKIYRYLDMIGDQPFHSRSKFMTNYLNSRVPLTYINQGSSRMVFHIENTKYVIKVAYNKKGIAQNRVECNEIFKEHSKFFAKIFKYDPKYNWIIAEKADPVDEDLIRNLLGFNTHFFGNFFTPRLMRSKKIKQRMDSNAYAKELQKSLFTINKKMPLCLPGDYDSASSYGIINGKLKIVDYGFNLNILNRYYR